MVDPVWKDMNAKEGWFEESYLIKKEILFAKRESAGSIEIVLSGRKRQREDIDSVSNFSYVSKKKRNNKAKSKLKEKRGAQFLMDKYGTTDWKEVFLLITDQVIEQGHPDSEQFSRPLQRFDMDLLTWERFQAEIPDPVDLGSVRTNIFNDTYQDITQCHAAILKMFRDFKHFNPPNTAGYESAVNLEELYWQIISPFKKEYNLNMIEGENRF